jgi:hypothetical protein
VALAGEDERALHFLLVDRLAVAAVVLADDREQIAEQLTLDLGQIARDRVDRRRLRGTLLDPDPGPVRLDDRRDRCSVLGGGVRARQGSVLRLCRYLRPS